MTRFVLLLVCVVSIRGKYLLVETDESKGVSTNEESYEESGKDYRSSRCSCPKVKFDNLSVGYYINKVLTFNRIMSLYVAKMAKLITTIAL